MSAEGGAEELEAVADLVELANVQLVQVLGTRAVSPRVRQILFRVLIEAHRRAGTGASTPMFSPRVALDQAPLQSPKDRRRR